MAARREPTGGLALLLVALLAAPGFALDFAACAEQGHEEFDCATLTVPLDRSGAVSGAIDLHVERLRGRPPDLPVLVALAGGPGQSATSVAETFAAVLEEAADAVQLVVFDQRGTGLSGALDCPRLGRPPARRRCARGPAGAFYRTADSVGDLDALRAALGVDRLTLLGVSYGTFVAAEYARTFPERVRALVLDSPVGPDGVELLAVTTARATARVLRALCAAGACAGVTADPLGDTAALVERLGRRPLRGPVRVPGRRPARLTLDGEGLLSLLVDGDLDARLRALYPAAVAAALRGDRAPILRLSWMARAGGSVARPGRAAEDVREHSDTLYLATSCADVRVPWGADDGLRRRRRALASAAGALSAGDLFPFDRASLVGFDVAGDCLTWPRTALPGAVVLGALPDVPALVLAGEADLRTPVENAAALARGMPRVLTVRAPHTGHSVLTERPCARRAMTDFLTGVAPADPCADLQPDVPVQPPAPARLDELPEAPGVGGHAGRTLTAVEHTLADALLAAAVVDGDVGGLRGGTIRCPNECPDSGRVLELRRVSLVRGVTVSGTITQANEPSWTASVTVGGRDAAGGSLVFHPDRRVTGRLGGHDVVATAGITAGLAETSGALPPIAPRRRRAD